MEKGFEVLKLKKTYVKKKNNDASSSEKQILGGGMGELMTQARANAQLSHIQIAKNIAYFSEFSIDLENKMRSQLT